jgi:surface antigen
MLEPTAYSLQPTAYYAAYNGNSTTALGAVLLCSRSTYSRNIEVEECSILHCTPYAATRRTEEATINSSMYVLLISK